MTTDPASQVSTQFAETRPATRSTSRLCFRFAPAFTMFTRVGLFVALVGLLGVVRSQNPTCKGQGYDAGFYNCLGGEYLCPKTLCACPQNVAPFFACYAQSAYHCPAPGVGRDGLTSDLNQPDTAGICAASSTADPLMRGFDGCEWYLKGEAGSAVNLVTEAHHVVNTYLVPANLTDEHHNNDGTFHGAISVRFQAAYVVTTVNEFGNLTVTLNQDSVPFGTIREKTGLVVNVQEHYPYYGQVAEITTPAFRFFIHAVQPYTDAAGWNRGHLDFTTEATAANLNVHGLLGQTLRKAGPSCPKDFAFHGEGTEAHYVVASMESTNFHYSLYNAEKPARRLHSAVPMYEPLDVPMAAGSPRDFVRHN